jgi:thiamine pyrophosphokinase
LVIAGGQSGPPAALARRLGLFDVVIAADSGVHHAQALGVPIDLVVGDFDSVTDAAVALAVADGATLERFPTAKDQTDLELAVDRAVEVGGAGAHVVVVASVAGRLDHALANLLLLTSPAYAECRVDAFVDRWLVSVLRDETRTFVSTPEQTVTLLVVHPEGARIATQGLAYPLRDEVVYRSSTRGVSNVALGDLFEVRVDGGVLLVLREWAD